MEGLRHRGGLSSLSSHGQPGLPRCGGCQPVPSVGHQGSWSACQAEAEEAELGGTLQNLSLPGPGWGWKENLSLAWTEGPGTWVRGTHHQARRASGWGTMQEGRARSTVWVRPKGRAPSPAADEPLLSSLPSPPGFPVASAQPGEGKQQLPKTPGPPTGTVLPTPHSLRSCFWSRWFPAAGGGGTRDQLRSRRPSTSVKLQLCVTLGKSLLSEP